MNDLYVQTGAADSPTPRGGHKRTSSTQGVPIPSTGLEDMFSWHPTLDLRMHAPHAVIKMEVQFYGTSVQVHYGINRHL